MPAKADGALGNFAAALEALKAISQVGPVTLDPEYKEAVEFVRARWEEAKARRAR